MAEALSQREPPSADIAGEEPPATPGNVHTGKAVPIFRLSPRYNGSSLYDSYEFRAVTKQINKAMQGTNINSSPALVSFLRSPFYNKFLDSFYKDSTSTPKTVTCSRLFLSGRSHSKRASSMSTTTTRAAGGGLVCKLWKKVKQGLLLRNK